MITTPTHPGTEKLVKRFIRMFKCDTARITRPCGRWFLVLGWNENTKRDRKKNHSIGQWVKNGVPIDFDYVREACIASGDTEKELIASAKHYKKLSGMTWEQVFKKGFKWAFPTMALLVLCSCGPLIDVKHGIVSTGFLSQTQAFSGSLKNKDGSATWSVVGHDGTTVANNALLYGGVVSAGNNTLKTVQNNNATATTQQAQQQASTLALQNSQQAATAAAAKVTQQTTARAAGVPALVKP